VVAAVVVQGTGKEYQGAAVEWASEVGVLAAAHVVGQPDALTAPLPLSLGEQAQWGALMDAAVQHCMLVATAQQWACEQGQMQGPSPAAQDLYQNLI
jgi:hypothetical protein